MRLPARTSCVSVPPVVPASHLTYNSESGTFVLRARAECRGGVEGSPAIHDRTLNTVAVAEYKLLFPATGARARFSQATQEMNVAAVPVRRGFVAAEADRPFLIKRIGIGPVR